ncbi:manganese efflux pump MntP [Bacillus sp. FJAT-45350]|uniref:manganese efflux pump MntP n=1 Tax=Bacillus sp. FJAT-45350 TaxID=2011014 RepID=UPI000BB80868|nr:manganese efflux pump MntP family protein [Bacillus sp. FJAT-45350]
MVGEVITLLIMATALGMDAFSIALGMGMIGLRYRQIFQIGITIGAFHIIMPLLGIVAGKLLSNYFGVLATIIGGGLLLLIGLQMIYSSLRGDEDGETKLAPIGIGLFLFAISVSLDSFSAGLSLGMLGAKTVITVVAFGVMSMILSWIGLIMGKKFKGVIGSYGELLGGCILIAFGVKLLLP